MSKWRRILSYTYDGDTAPGIRSKVRKAGHIVLTNPDMLHSGILPHHTKWVSLFENLKYIVIDELHTYKGVFGSHVAHVLTTVETNLSIIMAAIRCLFAHLQRLQIQKN